MLQNVYLRIPSVREQDLHNTCIYTQVGFKESIRFSNPHKSRSLQQIYELLGECSNQCPEMKDVCFPKHCFFAVENNTSSGTPLKSARCADHRVWVECLVAHIFFVGWCCNFRCQSSVCCKYNRKLGVQFSCGQHYVLQGWKSLTDSRTLKTHGV